ncbi:MAG TPA: tetratricopeptide repeat protein [Burkholderiaceae bacterium]|nr:tetratricopeptide repeat protein [Burkholderiaceae bacterium]
MSAPPTTLSATAPAEARELYARGLWHFVSFYGDPLAAFDATLAAAPRWGLAHVVKAVFVLTLTEPAMLPLARQSLADAEPLMADASAPERGHFEAARAALAGRWHDACARWDALLLADPLDALALGAAHLFDFYRGDARNLRARVARVLPEWPRDDPLQPFVLGMHAFGLEECNLYGAAEQAGRAALERDPRGPWAIHAVAHVMEMQGRHTEGAAWLEARRTDWADNGLAVHLWWHLGLFRLEALDTAGALALYDAAIAGAAAGVNLQWLDAAALLWRLRLLGVDTGPRWQALAADWGDPLGHAGHYAFNDVHALLALLGSGDLGRAEALLRAVIERAARPDAADNGAMAREVGVPLMQALIAFERGDAGAALALLYPLRAVAHRFGGSHAQRDLIDQTLLAAAARSRDRSDGQAIGRALLNERRLAKPMTPLTAHWAARLGAPHPID